MLAISENHRKIIFFVPIPAGPEMNYNPHIKVADEDDNPRLRSPLFYL
jgi:hypothetical protein